MSYTFCCTLADLQAYAAERCPITVCGHRINPADVIAKIPRRVHRPELRVEVVVESTGAWSVRY